MGTVVWGEPWAMPFSYGATARMRFFLFFLTILLNLPVSAQANMRLPVDGAVTSGVGWRVDPFGTGKKVFHRGIDIAVPVGTPVRATRQGRVVLAGERRGYGATVVVEHDNGDRTLYGHNSALKVRKGDMVEAGTVVAYSGNTGRSTGPHVHYEQIPSGRPVTDDAATLEVAKSDAAKAGSQRHQLEQKMEESLKSLLETIRSDINGG